MVGVVSWIEGPCAIGIDGQARDFSAKEAVGDGVSGIGIGCGELTGDGGCIFCGGLRLREGGNRSVIGTGESDDKGAVIGEAIGVSDLIVDGDGLDLTFARAL